MITEDYVSFEVAKLLKEKGFNEPTFTYYNNTGNLMTSYDFCCDYISGCFNNIKDKKVNCAAPTLQMAIKWLREVHNILIGINITYIDNKLTYLWIPCVIKQGYIDYPTMEEYMADSYEEAAEAAIKYCLTNLI